MNLTDLVGWLATAVLIATLSRQIYKQSQSSDIQAVSSWLFVGQITASCLFIAYSALVDNLVFVVTNGLVLLTALVGQYLAWRKRRRIEAQRSGAATGADPR